MRRRRKFIHKIGCMEYAINASVIYETKSKYQTITIAENECLGKMLFLDGVIQFATSDEFIFHEMMVYPMLSLVNVKNALILGGGDGFIAYELLKNNIKTTMVELDKDVVEVTKRYFEKSKKAFSDNRVSLVVGDALTYNTDEKYDAVFVDLVDYYSNPELYSKKALDKFKSLGKYLVFHADSFVYNNVFSAITNSFSNSITLSAYVPSFSSLWTFIIASDSPLDEKKVFSSSFKGKYFSKDVLCKYNEKISTITGEF